jgi:hypothetical protein
MPIVSKSFAESAIQPYLADLTHIVQSAWTDWRNNELASMMQDKRLRADVVSNQMIVHARRRFEGSEDVRVDKFAQSRGLLVGKDIYVRFKKADHKLLSRNFPTPAARAFRDQTQDEMFGGIIRLELVYVLDDSETEVERIALIQRHINSIVWVLDLAGEAPMRQNLIPFAPAPTPTPDGTVASRVIKPKTTKTDDDQQVNKE